MEGGGQAPTERRDEDMSKTRTVSKYTIPGGIEREESVREDDEGRVLGISIAYTKGERKAVVEYLPGYHPWGRSNACMYPYVAGKCGRVRTYKDHGNAQAKAREFVLGK